MSAVVRAASPADAHAIARVHVASLRVSSNDLPTLAAPRVFTTSSGLRQSTASEALRTSVTSMCAGVWVIAMGGRAARSAT